jgi:hypothetical protein
VTRLERVRGVAPSTGPPPALRLLPKKQLPLPQGRPLQDVTPYYSRSVDRRKEFVLGSKPGVLKGVGSIHKKVWKQYQTHLSRTTPLERAEFYAREMKERRMRSFRALSLLQEEYKLRKRA